MEGVSVYNEWDPLEEVIVGTILGGQIPAADMSLHAVDYSDLKDADEIPSGPFPRHVVDTTERELDELAHTLTGLGICVRRPSVVDRRAVVATPDWQTDGYFDYCPRDGILTIGNTIVESPMVLRARMFESLAYKDIFLDYFEAGSHWISAPKPRLRADMYDVSARPGERLLNTEPAFDAANVLRFGRDLVYLVSDTGNERGLVWLQRALGPDYTIHALRDVYAYSHVDSTIVPIEPGLLLVNPSRVTRDKLPPFLANWKLITCPKLADTGYVGRRPACSTWIGMNLLVVSPGRVIVDQRQTALIRELVRHGVDVIPLQLTHTRTLSGGFHCVTLDIRRRGTLQSYR